MSRSTERKVKAAKENKASQPVYIFRLLDPPLERARARTIQKGARDSQAGHACRRRRQLLGRGVNVVSVQRARVSMI